MAFGMTDLMTHSLLITCADGLEQALLTELDGFGIAGTQVRAGRVAVSVSLAQFYQICLYSRVASRVVLPLGDYYFKKKQVTEQGIIKEVIADDVANVLYEFASRIDWTAVFGVEHTFAVRVSVDKRVSVNQQFATMRVKDAIADCFNRQFGSRPDVDAKNPNFAIFVQVGVDCAEIGLDLSGTSLHRRGYRVANTEAPLKENLAAALLYEAGWHLGHFDALIDPMCGSGTFVIEALLMRVNYPVGLDKSTNQFGFYHWQHHDDELWQACVARATTDFHDNLANFEAKPISIIATDANAHAIYATHKNLLAAGLATLTPVIRLEQRAMSGLDELLATVKASNPLIISNPPYGERLGDDDVIKPLYQGLGRKVADGLRQAGIEGGYLAILASHIEHADVLPIVNPQTLRCHNGALTVYFRHGRPNTTSLPSLIERFERKEVVHDEAQEFVNRLQKNLANLKKIAKKQGVTNLRVYDADLPNYNVAVDIYGEHVHVQEYAPPKSIDAQVAKHRFNNALAVIRQVLDVNREQVFIKTRAKQSGNEQYTKIDHKKRKKLWLAQENGAYFYVNFTDYLDTGLFIDHRTMRGLVGQASRGKRVLNLFSYTCTASVHAALHGAKTVTSVDLSANYLDWGRQNFSLNGLVLDAMYDHDLKYQFIAADVFEWIKDNTEQFDVIFIDPPTFSNSKKFKGTFDVQRDHAALINRAMNRLSHDGVLYFSNNFTKFELDEHLKTRYEVLEMTQKTIGFDFDDKKPIHQSYQIRHKNSTKSSASPDGTAANNQRADDKVVGSSTDLVKSSKFTPQKAPSQQARQEKGFAKKHHGTALGNHRQFAKHSSTRTNKKADFDKSAGNNQISKPSIKRVYVNPKLAGADEMAKRLDQKLHEQSSQTPRKYKVKTTS